MMVKTFKSLSLGLPLSGDIPTPFLVELCCGTEKTLLTLIYSHPGRFLYSNNAR